MSLIYRILFLATVVNAAGCWWIAMAAYICTLSNRRRDLPRPAILEGPVRLFLVPSRLMERGRLYRVVCLSSTMAFVALLGVACAIARLGHLR